MMKRTLIAIVLGGCTAELAPGAADPDVDAEPDDPSTVDTIDTLITANEQAPVAIADAATVDADRDGIADATEELMLRRYRPYYRFSQASGEDETFRPADAIDVLSHAQLVVDAPNGGGTSGPVAGCGRAGDAHLAPPETLYAGA